MQFSVRIGAAWVAAGLAVAGATAALSAWAKGQAVDLAPHRATYEVTLERSTPGSGVAELVGRMVYELTGSSCEGYTQNFRYVTVATDQEGTSTTADLRSSSWEDASGRRLRFSTSQYRNNQLADVTQGDAAREGSSGPVQVAITKPEKRALTLPAKVYFPIQHAMALIAAARAGQPILTADLYDGSEQGAKISPTTAVIGRQAAPGAVKSPASLKNGDKLDALPSWPISISFFDEGKDLSDAVPTSEQSYRFYANGVSTNLVSDYGDHTLRFELSELTFLPHGDCQAKR